MYQLVRILLATIMLFTSTLCLAAAENTSAYSEPYHAQARGWYPSFYWSTGRNLGSYYLPNTDGDLFEVLDNWDREENALVYFYRPDSQWASEELTAPSYYINDEPIFNLRAGSFTYVELPAGSYDFAVRKSLLPLIGFEAFDDKLMMAFDLNLQANVGLQLNAGTITYIRHSEVSLPSKRHSDLDAEDEMASADVQLVEEDVAMEEIVKTRYLTSSFWHPSDAAEAEELLSGDMQEYGWFSVIWPWSNNFMWGFPIFYLPSDIYRKLRGDVDITLEQELYLLADDKEAYLAEIENRRQVKRNWLAPWRKPPNPLSLNDELLLERLERNARAGKIAPAPIVKEELPPREDGEPWYTFFIEDDVDPVKEALAKRYESMSEQRRNNMDRIKQTLN